MIGTGFLLLSRRCLERMVAVHGAHSFAVLPALPGWPGFEDPEMFVPEDVAFCTRWQALGGRIFCDPRVGLAHFGTSCASVSMAEALEAEPGAVDGRQHGQRRAVGGVNRSFTRASSW
ncbi:MAG: hypothetical protein U1E17_12735 [Geminicoccaceae bacterium]